MPYHLQFHDVPREPQFVAPVAVDRSGATGPTKAQAVGPRWRRTSPGLYVPAEVDPHPPAQRAVEAAGRLSRSGALTGWAVMHLSGCRFFDGTAANGRLPVRLQMGPHRGRRRRPGIQWRYDTVGVREEVRGVPCVPRAWAVFDEMRSGDLVHAVVCLDMALRAGFVQLPDMRAFVEDRAGSTGVPLVRHALEVASPHSGSPPETRVRLLWEVELGLPRPLVNVAVLTRDGDLLGYPDLLDVEAGLAVEYDGEGHRDPGRHSADVDREAAFREVGLEVTRLTAGDLRNHVALARRLLAARSRARFEPADRRRWTLGR